VAFRRQPRRARLEGQSTIREGGVSEIPASRAGTHTRRPPGPGVSAVWVSSMSTIRWQILQATVGAGRSRLRCRSAGPPAQAPDSQLSDIGDSLR
jgi:hypothetical protein